MKKRTALSVNLAVAGATVLTAAPAMSDTILEDLLEHVRLLRNDQAIGGSEGQITGVPGSPSATITIDGKQLPAPPQKFEGKIGRTAAESKPYWPARIRLPRGRPTCC